MANIDRCTSRIVTLQEDLLFEIAKRLPTRIDILRSVCFSFRKSFPLPPKTSSPYSITGVSIPATIPPILDVSQLTLNEYTLHAFQPIEKTPKPSETAETLLLYTEQLISGKVGVVNPRCNYRYLADFKEKKLNLLDYKVKEIFIVHSLRFFEDEVLFNPKKVVSSKCLDKIDDHDFALMCLFRGGLVEVWRKGDVQWTNVNAYVGLFLDDIVYHNNKFYVIATSGLTLSVDCESGVLTKVVENLPESYDKTSRYLVESLNELYLVVRHSYRIEFFKLDEEKHEWVKLEHGLEDRFLFVGDWGSFSSKEFAGYKGNHLYIVDDARFLTVDMSTKEYDPQPGWYPAASNKFLPPTWLKL